MKSIIIENLNLILKFFNGNISYWKYILYRCQMDTKSHYNASPLNFLVNFNKFIFKIVSLQNITLKGFSKNVIPILPISRSFQYHHHILISNTSKTIIINRYYLQFPKFPFHKLQNTTTNILSVNHKLLPTT